MRFRLLLPFVFFAALTGPALSLSCAYLDAAAMFQQAAEASERYVIVRGAFLRVPPIGKTHAASAFRFSHCALAGNA